MQCTQSPTGLTPRLDWTLPKINEIRVFTGGFHHWACSLQLVLSVDLRARARGKKKVFPLGLTDNNRDQNSDSGSRRSRFCSREPSGWERLSSAARTTAGRGAPPETTSQRHRGRTPRTRAAAAEPVPPSLNLSANACPTARLTWDSQAHRDSEPLWSLESSQRPNQSTAGSASEPRPAGGAQPPL